MFQVQTLQMWPQTPRQQKKSMTMAMQEAIVTVL